MPVADNLLSHIPAFRSLRAAHYSENFSVFARAAWSVVFPGRALVWSPAYDLLCELLVAIKARCALSSHDLEPAAAHRKELLLQHRMAGVDVVDATRTHVRVRVVLDGLER